MSDAYKKISKFLSYVLRHRTDEIGLTLDSKGWAAVAVPWRYRAVGGPAVEGC